MPKLLKIPVQWRGGWPKGMAMKPIGPRDTLGVRILQPQDVLRYAVQFCEAKSLNELRDRAAAVFADYGFKGFSFAVVRRVKNVYLHALVLSSWPAAVQNAFQRDRLFNVDPIIIRSRFTTEPFAWDMSEYDESLPTHQEIVALRRSAGIAGGICLPVFEAFHGRSVLFLTGSGFDTSDQTLLGFQLMAEHLSNRVNALSMAAHTADLPGHVFLSDRELSPRERQVFGWIAFGKSSREIAVIMSISEHTVNDYIASAMGKLNASNRVEAVMRALLTNQIDLVS
jgi:DNA-binding CsgD family transcriptional regulator